MRRISVLMVIVALAGNIFFDVLSYRQAMVTERTGSWVENRYQLSLELDRLSRHYSDLLHQAATGQPVKSLSSTMHEIAAQLAKLKGMETAYPDQIRGLDQLERDLIATQSADRPKEILSHAYRINLDFRRIRTREMALLRERLDQDNRADRGARVDLVWGSVIDTILVLLLSALFWLDQRNRRRTEEALRSTIQGLNEANQSLAKLNLSKVESFKSAVHDLKNPLGSIRGFADLIADEWENRESVMEMSKVIQRVSRQTLEIVNALLERPLENATFEEIAERLDLAECIASACEELSPQSLRKRQTVNFSPPPFAILILGQRKKIREIFLNLIGNAIKFSPNGGLISVRLSRTPVTARVEIEDQGPGLTESDKDKLFIKYQTLSARPTGDELSTGLGLYLVKESVQRHGGKVAACTPLSGHGTCFTVELPLLSVASGQEPVLPI